MAITGFNHFNLRAPRELLDKLRDFYSQVVGLRVGDRPAFANPGYWLCIGDHDVLHLAETTPDEPPRAADVRGVFDHVAFVCTGLSATQARLTELGVRFRRIDSTGQSGLVVLLLRDPAGNGVELDFYNEPA